GEPVGVRAAIACADADRIGRRGASRAEREGCAIVCCAARRPPLFDAAIRTFAAATAKQGGFSAGCRVVLSELSDHRRQAGSDRAGKNGGGEAADGTAAACIRAAVSEPFGQGG